MTTATKQLAILFALAVFVVVPAMRLPRCLNLASSQPAEKEGAGDAVQEKKKPGLSEKEIRIRKTLNSHLNINFKRIQIRELLEFLQDKTSKVCDLQFFLDEQGLKEAGVHDPDAAFYNDTVTLKATNIKVGKLLNLILRERGMGYFYDEDIGALVLTPKSKLVVVKVYDLGDLLDPKNVAVSSAELQKTLKLVDPDLTFSTDPDAKSKNILDSKTEPAAQNAQILTHKSRLVVRESPEMHQEIERVLLELKGITPPRTRSSDDEFPGIDLDSRR